MSKRNLAALLTCFVLVLCSGGLRSALCAAPPAQDPPVDTVARELHRILANLRHTKYSHPTHVDEEKGSYELDCSGLACYMLKRVLPEHYQNVTIPKGQSRATAMNFHDYFAQAPTTPEGKDGWRRIERIWDVRPGDILAWRAATPKPGATGHVIIIDSLPFLLPDRQVCVAIVDSTSTGHGNDSRPKGQTGIGRGLMWFVTDPQGRPVAYRWSHPAGTLQERSIAIGRPVPLK